MEVRPHLDCAISDKLPLNHTSAAGPASSLFAFVLSVYFLRSSEPTSELDRVVRT
jgi:hypothetical protein